ncbi:MAG TPA: hypothetical protein VGT06_01805 [Candidatus Methylomirabilis sp.]|nr:hypothetical protein [Candidatus Methylomirabilis sp.]
MKKLVAFGLLVATVAFAGTAVADGGTLQDRELQKLFEFSAQAPQSARPVAPAAEIHGLLEQEVRELIQWSAQAAAEATLAAGPGAGASREIPPVLEYRGSEIK